MRNMKIYEIVGVRERAGEIGLEVEMEGPGVSGINTEGSSWTLHRDGSLRGEAAEFVLRRPVPRNRVNSHLDTLWRCFDGAAELQPSARCGVHVHVNCQQMSEKQAFSFLCVAMAFDDLFVHWASPDRAGNLFCLRATDAHYLSRQLSIAREKNDILYAAGDDVRYASINVNALLKFGSLEFRALPTEKGPERIKTWVKMILALKDWSDHYEHPRQIVEDMSANGTDEYIKMVLGGNTDLLKIPERDDLMLAGIRNVQDVAYTVPFDAMPNIARPGFYVDGARRVRERGNPGEGVEAPWRRGPQPLGPGDEQFGERHRHLPEDFNEWEPEEQEEYLHMLEQQEDYEQADEEELI